MTNYIISLIRTLNRLIVLLAKRVHYQTVSIGLAHELTTSNAF